MDGDIKAELELLVEKLVAELELERMQKKRLQHHNSQLLSEVNQL